jgi:hypothetical protein
LVNFLGTENLSASNKINYLSRSFFGRILIIFQGEIDEIFHQHDSDNGEYFGTPCPHYPAISISILGWTMDWKCRSAKKVERDER